MLKGKSALVPRLPSDEVYKSFNVWVGNSRFISSKNIENPVICFKVEKSWLQNHSIDNSSITLNRYNDKKWSPNPTYLLREDSKYRYFTANVSGFSYFVITGKEESIPGENRNEIEFKSENKTTNEYDKENTEVESKNKGIQGTPGFEIGFGVAFLLGLSLYKRK
jgi:hypothetical protein